MMRSRTAAPTTSRSWWGGRRRRRDGYEGVPFGVAPASSHPARPVCIFSRSTSRFPLLPLPRSAHCPVRCFLLLAAPVARPGPRRDRGQPEAHFRLHLLRHPALRPRPLDRGRHRLHHASSAPPGRSAAATSSATTRRPVRAAFSSPRRASFRPATRCPSPSPTTPGPPTRSASSSSPTPRRCGARTPAATTGSSIAPRPPSSRWAASSRSRRSCTPSSLPRAIASRT